METLLLFIKGMGVGLFIAVPLGPVGLLCLRRTIDCGRRYGFVSGLGAATADAVFAAVAAFGLSWFSHALLGAGPWLRMVGCALVIILGVFMFRGRYKQQQARAQSASWLGGFASTFAITITSPITIVAFAAIFAGLGLATGPDQSWRHAGALVLGVFCGSASWWLVVALVGGWFRTLMDERKILLINRLAGAALVALGLAGIAAALLQSPAGPVP